MVDQLMVSQFHVGAMWIGVAELWRLKMTTATVTSSAPSSHMANAACFPSPLAHLHTDQVGAERDPMATSDGEQRRGCQASQAYAGTQT